MFSSFCIGVCVYVLCRNMRCELSLSRISTNLALIHMECIVKLNAALCFFVFFRLLIFRSFLAHFSRCLYTLALILLFFVWLKKFTSSSGSFQHLTFECQILPLQYNAILHYTHIHILSRKNKKSVQ